MDTLKKRAQKIREWLKENDDKPGKQGQPLKNNLTDNESAKMKTSRGVIQGYNGVAVVDDKHQVIVHAEAFGASQEHDLLEPMVRGNPGKLRAAWGEGDLREGPVGGRQRLF